MALSRYAGADIIKGGRAISSSDACHAIRNAVKRGIIPVTKVVVKEGDRLDHLAHSAYGNGRLWWVIAAASGIGWALQIPPGTVVSIPSDLSQVASLVN